jgi:hypothetical protein
MVASVWKDVFIIHVYELAKSGLTETAMSRVLNISTPTFRLWEKKKKLFRMAVQMGRKEYRGQGKLAVTLQDYIYRRLDPSLRKKWDYINRLSKEKKAQKKLEAFLENQGKTVRQHLCLYAYTVSNFNIAYALRKVNISRSTFDLWRKSDPEFGQIVKEIDEYKKDFFESHLIKMVAGGDPSATIFVNKTHNQDRYPDPKKQVDLNVSGHITTNALPIGQLKLPLKTRKEILKAIQAYKKENEKD